jgi:hypothetical protein
LGIALLPVWMIGDLHAAPPVDPVSFTAVAAAECSGPPGGSPDPPASAATPRDTCEEVDVAVPVKPERCRQFQQPLQGEDPQPQRHQVTEMPPVRPVVTDSLTWYPIE